MNFFDLCALGAYFIFLIYIGYKSASKVSSSDDFAVAGNKITWPILFATLAASFLGGGASMGRAGQSFEQGYAFMFAGVGGAVGALLVGLFIAPKLKRYTKAHTVGDIMEAHYGVPTRLFTGIFSLVFCMGILGAQALAIGTVFNAILGISVSTGIIIGMVVVLIYSTVGGMWAVIQTDVIQFVMLAIFMPITMVIGVHAVGGPEAMMSKIPEAHFSIMGTYSIGAFVSLFVAFMLGEALVPPYTQRALAAPTARDAKIGYSISGLASFIFAFISSTIGMSALLLFPDISPDQALPMLIKHSLPVGITGLVLASLLAVIMSTADSYLNSAAVVFVEDIYVRFIDPDIAEKKRLRVERLTNLLIGIGAILFALFATSIIDALLVTYMFWAPTILFPFAFGVFFNIKCTKSGLSAMIIGAMVTFIWNFSAFDFKAATGITALIAGVSANIVTFISVYLIFAKNNDQQKVTDSN